MASDRMVGESYRDACSRLYGQLRAAEIDRDRCAAELAVIEQKRLDYDARRAAFDEEWKAAREGRGPVPRSATPPITAEEAAERFTDYLYNEKEDREPFFTYMMHAAWNGAQREIMRLRELLNVPNHRCSCGRPCRVDHCPGSTS